MPGTNDLTLLRIEDMAELLVCDTQTVRRLCRQGDIPATRIGGRWYITRADFERLVRARVTETRLDYRVEEAPVLASA